MPSHPPHHRHSTSKQDHSAHHNIVAIPLAAGVLYNLGLLLGPAVGAMLMSMSTALVAINARILQVRA